jgi:tRNA(Ile)-lysidine synthase
VLHQLRQNKTLEQTVSCVLDQGLMETALLVAVSGGADSTALLYALSEIKKSNIFVLHVDHGIRSKKECYEDAQWVKQLCVHLNVPCRVIHVPCGKIQQIAQQKHIGIEAAARLCRHSILQREARRIGAQKICIAHTKDDLLENILMRFFRGSGPDGLASMQEQSKNIVRPLITVTRKEIIHYLSEKKSVYRSDSTNNDNRFLRNKFRNLLIPYLNELIPHWQKAVHHGAETQYLIAHYLNEEAQKHIKWQKINDGLMTDSKIFFEQNPIIREEALFYATDTVVKNRSQQSYKPDTVSKKITVPKRRVFRSFNQHTRALDAGPVRIVQKNNTITVHPYQSAIEEAFTFVIEKIGLYTFKKLNINCTAESENNGFYTELPVVLYGNNRTITVEDIQGTVGYMFCTDNLITIKHIRTHGTFFIAFSYDGKTFDS